MAGSAARPNSRNSAGRKPARAGVARRDAKPSALGRVFARPGMIVAGATFAAVMTGIVANALLFQHGHHPSPLFSPVPAEATAPTPLLAPPVAAPVPPAASAQRQVVERPAPAADAPAPAQVAPPTSRKPALKPAHFAFQPGTKATVPTKPAAVRHRDAIADLLAKQGH